MMSCSVHYSGCSHTITRDHFIMAGSPEGICWYVVIVTVQSQGPDSIFKMVHFVADNFNFFIICFYYNDSLQN